MGYNNQVTVKACLPLVSTTDPEMNHAMQTVLCTIQSVQFALRERNHTSHTFKLIKPYCAKHASQIEACKAFSHWSYIFIVISVMAPIECRNVS